MSYLYKRFFVLLFALLISKGISAQSLDWVHRFGGTADEAVIKSIITDGDSNIIIVGYFRGTLDLNPDTAVSYTITSGSWDEDGFIVKLDSNSHFIWGFKIGEINYDDWISSVQTDEQNNIYIAGKIGSPTDINPGTGTYLLTNHGGADAFVAKYNTNGNLLWGFSIGSTANDQVNALAYDHHGGIFAGGIYDNTIDLNPDTGTSVFTSFAPPDCFIAHYDSTGHYIQGFRLGSIGVENITDVTCDTAGNLIVCGNIGGSVDFDPSTANYGLGLVNGHPPAFIAKYSLQSTLIWAFIIGGNSGYDRCNTVTTDQAGNIYAGGLFLDTVDFNPSGSAVYSLVSSGFEDAYLAKYSPNKIFQWAFKIGSPGADEFISDVKTNQNNRVYATGSFKGTVDIDPGANTVNLISNGNNDIMLLEYDNAGTYINGFGMGGSSYDDGQYIAGDNSGNLIVNGTYKNIVDFDPGLGTDTLSGSTTTTFNCFLARYNINGILSAGNEMIDSKESVIVLSPNPNDGDFSINYDPPTDNSASLQIHNVNGALVYTQKIPIWSTVQNLQLHNILKAGMYALTLQNGGRRGMIKFVVR